MAVGRIKVWASFYGPSQLEKILSMGFQNKFYNAKVSSPNPESAGGLNEYRINVSSDTPHWYVMDYLTRVSQYYGIRSAYVNGKMMTHSYLITWFCENSECNLLYIEQWTKHGLIISLSEERKTLNVKINVRNYFQIIVLVKQKLTKLWFYSDYLKKYQHIFWKMRVND